MIPVDALHIGAKVCVGDLPKEPQTAIMGVEAEKMGFDRPSILLIQTADQRWVAVLPFRQGIGREDLLILGVVRSGILSAVLRQLVIDRLRLTHRGRYCYIMPKTIKSIASPDDKKLCGGHLTCSRRVSLGLE